MCEVVLPRSSGHGAPNTLWKTNLSVFCHIFSLPQFLENKKTPTLQQFSVFCCFAKSAALDSQGQESKQKSKVFSGNVRLLSLQGRGVCLVGWAALLLAGRAPGLLLGMLCTVAGIPEPGSSGLWDTASMSWQVSALARRGCLWGDAVPKG